MLGVEFGVRVLINIGLLFLLFKLWVLFKVIWWLYLWVLINLRKLVDIFLKFGLDIFNIVYNLIWLFLVKFKYLLFFREYFIILLELIDFLICKLFNYLLV